MAKAPKAPGQNGPSDVAEVLARLEALAPAVGDGYWRAHVVVRGVGPAARCAGDARARALLPRLGEVDHLRAEALGALAEGLARRGDVDDARRALAECEAPLRDGTVDGEVGTLGWCAAARARHRLGDDAACDAALDAARACAKRERSNPTQPWPHLAMALADTGRADALLAQLRKLPARESLSFDIEKAARRTVARAVADGDAELFGRYLVRLQDHNGYVLAVGLREGAAGALRAGRSEALAGIVARFAAHPSYGGSTGAEVARQAAWAGDVALALRLAGVTRDRHPHPNADLAHAFADLGDEASCAQILVSCARPPAARPAGTVEDFVPYYRTLHARDPGLARAALPAHEAAAQAATGVPQATYLAALGLALVATGERAYGEALLTQAATVIAAVPKSAGGYQRGEALKRIGALAAAEGCWAPALALLRKSTSKHEKQVLAKGLTAAYARAGDLAGALAAAALAPSDPLHAMMAACDVLAEAAGYERPYESYA